MISKRKAIIIILAVLVLAGVGAAGYWYYQNSQKQEEVVISGKGPHPEAKFTKLSEKDLTAEEYTRYQAALEALEKMEGDKGALINLGYLFKKIGNLEDAKLAFTILATWDEIEPDPEGNLGLARVLIDQKNYKEAAETYYKILKTYPLYTLAYKEILDMYERKQAEIDPVFLTFVNHAREFDKAGEYKLDFDNLISRYNEIMNRQSIDASR